MKLKVSVLLFLLINLHTQAQNNNESGGFKRENIFLGGSLNLGFATGVFQIGANPEVGYSIAKFWDAGIITNLIYGSLNADYNAGVKQTSFNYGAGLFTRVYPIDFMFAQAQAEHNWISYRLKDEFSGSTLNQTLQSNSILLGIGYGRRVIGQSGFYTALLFDVTKNINSPYIDSYGNSLPILRGGFTIYLKPRSERKKGD